MKIQLTCLPPDRIVPFDHIPNLTGVIHKWLGINKEHGDISLYSFSWLEGGRKGNGGLHFPEGATWSISAHDPQLLKTIVAGIQADPVIAFGLRVSEITIMEDPKFEETNRFLLASPVLIKRRDGERTEHILYDHPKAGDYLTETMATKMDKAGMNPDGFSIAFDKDYHSPKSKMVNYKGIKNRASLCPVIIKGTSEQLAFAWNVGVGNSTGIGFGALK